MSRHNRTRRARLAAERATWHPDEERGSPPPRWFVAVFFAGSFAICAAFASGAVFLGAVQPVVAALGYRSTDGHWGGKYSGNRVLVSYEADGQTFRCVGSRHVESGSRPGGLLRVYYPADRPDRGFVCDWVGERRWRVDTWPMALFCLPFLTFALIWCWLGVVLERSSSVVGSAVRTVCLPFGSWFAGMFLSGAAWMLLIPDPKHMDHSPLAMLLQVVGGLVGGLWGLRWAAGPFRGGEGNG